jgi:uncharacterized protein DUF5979
VNRFLRRRSLVVLAFACLTAVLVSPIPAHADVNSVTGGGFAAQANVLGLVVLAPTPGGAPNGVNFTATEPVDGFNQNVPGVNVSLPQVLTANVLNVNSVAQGVAGENHAASVTTTSSVANVLVGPTVAPSLIADAISSTCTSNGDGSTGSTSVVNLRAPGSGPPLTDTFSGGPVDVSIPGIASIIINEQSEVNIPGVTTSIVVNAVHITLLGVTGAAAAEIILGQSRCSASGPDVLIPTGAVQVTKDAPADAQGTTFTFTITCLDPSGANVVGSPFMRTVTGDGTTTPVTGLTPGTICTASEAPASGFVSQPDQTFLPVASGVTRNVTFVNTRVAAQTGSVAVIKDAPADAQSVVFTFTINCTGVGSFTRTVTGDGTSTAVTGLPVGTACTAAESALAGFVSQPNQNFPAVVADTTQTVTFVNTRVTDGQTGSVAVIKDAPSDAQNVVFTFTINCTGVGSFTRTVTGDGTSATVSGLAPGTACTAAETTLSGFVDRPNQTFPTVVANTTQTVTFVNTRTAAGATTIQVDKSASPISRPQPGGTFTFTVRVTNNGSQPVTITSIQDDVHGNLNGRGTCATGASLTASPGPGNVYTCSFSVEFTGNSGASQTDKVTVTAVDSGGTSVSDISDGVTISITAPGTPIVPGSVIVPRTNFFFFTQPPAQAERDGAIIVNNNNSSSSSSSAAAAAGGAAGAPPPAAATPPQTLVRTGIDSLALTALALVLMMGGFVMLAARPAYAGGYRGSRKRRGRR